MPKTKELKLRKRLLLHVSTIVRRLSKDLGLDPRDTNYTIKRLNAEGIPFVTKTLPMYSKYCLLCLERGRVVDCREVGFTNFDTVKGAPRFMRGLLLSALSGSAEALFSIRQFCEYFYKTCFRFSKKDCVNAESRFVSTEKAIANEEINWGTVEECRKTFEYLFPKLSSSRIDDILSIGRPSDGPGAFAGSQKLGIPFELFKKQPSAEIGLCDRGYKDYSGLFRAISKREVIKLVDPRRTAEVRFVPKDSRGPRVISKEPYFSQKAQMAMGKYMVSHLEKKGNILFADQARHRDLARLSSIDRKHCTIDLKDASDRVRFDVVMRIFRNSPGLKGIALRSRSTHCTLPSGRFLKLKKFANMGSGMCFPTLALVVYLAAVIGCRRSGYHKTVAYRLPYVYGDDLIVPTSCFSNVKLALEQVGLIVNGDKSFSSGFFRESCGGDYYHGVDVAPVRLRLSSGGLPETSVSRNGTLPLSSDSGILQLERHCRELVKKGLNNLSEYYYSKLECVLGSLEIVSEACAALGRVDLRKIVPSAPVEAFVPVSSRDFSDTVCPYKGIAASLRSSNGLGEDWCLTPLRHQLKLKRRVLEPAQRVGYGLP